ncbi:hypothetical protein [Membranihabitans marinus]|uniref:hypothetical protein n=1 Tax=Membranihabitans marinus TaxID=1227546 RepID=UPI001F35D662|nr:hypothetical protein [Membranihabitans marinus]
MTIWDKTNNILMLPDKDVTNLKKSQDVFIGSSHTLYHLNDSLYQSLTGRQVHVVATGAQYGLESLHYLHLLGERKLLGGKKIYIQLETKDNINVHPEKSWIIINSKWKYLKTIWKYGHSDEKLNFLKAFFTDILSIEWLQKIRMRPYKYLPAEKIRKYVPFIEDEYKVAKKQRNGDKADHFSQKLIQKFIESIPIYQKMYNCEIIYYIAGGCHSNYYKHTENTHDLRWLSFMSDRDYWQDTNHLNSQGADLYTRSLIKIMISN